LKRNLNGWRLFIGLVAIALFVAACGGTSETTTTAAPGTTAATTTTAAATTAAPTTTTEATTTTAASMMGGVAHGAISEPPFIDPQLVSDSEGFSVARLLFNGLTVYDPAGGAVLPGVAESWDTNDDLTVWTFHLRPDVKFSDGNPLTAQDFVYGISRLADPDLASSVSYHGGEGYAGIVGFDDVVGSDPTGVVGDQLVEGLKAIDDQTLEIDLTTTNVLLPKILAHPAFSPVEKAVAEADGWADMPVGDGPYKMREPWQHDVAINLDRNDLFYGTAPNPDSVEFSIIADINAQYDALLAGDIDVMDGIPPEQVESAKSQYGDHFFEVATGSFAYLGFPTQTPPYDNIDIRRALVMAVDRDAINERILVGRTTANGFVPPVAYGSIEGECEYCKYDPEAAKALFDSAGGIPGNSVEIAFNSGGGHEEWINAVANDWHNNLGLDVTFKTLEWADYLEFLGITGGPPPVAPFRLGWQWDYPSAYNFLAPLYRTGSGDNFTQYSNPDFDALLEKAISQTTEDAAVPYLQDAQRILADDLPVMPLNYGQTRIAYNDTVSNVKYNDFGFFIWEQMVVNK
jgi:oligopeptide transport system substrate-binding protein